MSTLLEVALSCIVRGWHIFPCWPRTKKPMTQHGWHDATLDPRQVEAWWAKTPDANVAIACNPSNLCVVDIDHGLSGPDDLEAWLGALYGRRLDVEQTTYAVRTGRRPEFGAQVYFQGAIPDVGLWKQSGCEGQVKSLGGYVMAAGSIHPDSREPYEVFSDWPLADTPDWLRALKPERVAVADDEPITSNRNVALTSIAGKLRNAGLSAAALEVSLLQVNEDRCVPPLDEDEVKRIAANASKWELPSTSEVRIGPKMPEVKTHSGVPAGGVNGGQEGAVAARDWRSRYMTAAAFENVKPPTFLIDGFLVKGSITMLAGPVAQRKSIIALNVAHALCTGEPLFGYFDVPGGHERVVYLCPEMGAASFVKRIKQIGLGAYIGKTLFVQTMSEQQSALDELGAELPGAVVIIDTIIRFIEGDENKSEDMREFAKRVFRIVSAGATVVLLHHSKKGSAGTLDDGLRGSSELAAFVDSCWVTELEDPKKPYESLSKVRNVKQRDFESDPFKLKPTVGSYQLTMEGEPEPEAALKSKADEAATEVLRKLLSENPRTGVNKLCSALRAAGHGRGAKWVTAVRGGLVGTGVTLME